MFKSSERVTTLTYEMQPRFFTLCEKLGTEQDAHRRQVDLVRASLLAKPAKPAISHARR
jgi:hypothetical protein